MNLVSPENRWSTYQYEKLGDGDSIWLVKLLPSPDLSSPRLCEVFHATLSSAIGPTSHVAGWTGSVRVFQPRLHGTLIYVGRSYGDASHYGEWAISQHHSKLEIGSETHPTIKQANKSVDRCHLYQSERCVCTQPSGQANVLYLLQCRIHDHLSWRIHCAVRHSIQQDLYAWCILS